MGWNPGQSLKGFATSQPPLLVFTLCLMAFGLTMVVLAYLVGEYDLPNPDVQMDWNKLLMKITKLDMCLPFKETSNFNNSNKDTGSHLFNSQFNLTSNFSTLRFVDEGKSLSAVLSHVVNKASEESPIDSVIVNVSVKVRLWVSGTLTAFISTPTFVKGTINGEQLGLKGKLAQEYLNVTIGFSSLLNGSCENGCQVVRTIRSACIQMQMPLSLLPHTKSPDRCHKEDMWHEDDATVVDFVQDEDVVSGAACQKHSHLHLKYIPDLQLTEMLTVHERSIVNLHLMHTSYFMFVMVMTLLCYALIKGRYRTPKGILMEKVPIDA